MKINFNTKRLFAFLLGGVIFVVSRSAINSGQATKETDEGVKIVSTDVVGDQKTNVEIPNITSNEQFANLFFSGAVNLFFQRGDMEATVNVNLRRGNGIEYDSIDKICGGDLVRVYGIAENGWYLLSYNGVLGFAHSNYFKNETFSAETMDYIKSIQKNMESLDSNYVVQNNKVVKGQMEAQPIYDMYPNILPIDGVMYANSNVHFRTGPSKKDESLALIKRGRELKIFGIENGWYLVEYNGKLGYVYSYYLSYNKDANYRDDFLDVVYVNYETPLYYSDSESSGAKYFFNKYEVCEVLAMNDEWYYVRYEDMYGYIKRDCTAKVANEAVVIDIDNQRLTLYRNNNIIVETDIVTGLLGVHDTPTGMYSIRNKVTDTVLSSKTYGYNQPVDYWMPFNGGIGLHDASWRSKFGGDIYVNNGSHGCVNIPPKYADDVFDNVNRGTKVIVHK